MPNNLNMALYNDFMLDDLRHATIRSWLSIVIHLCQRLKHITPYLALRRLETFANYHVSDNELHFDELHIETGVRGRQHAPHEGSSHSGRTTTPLAGDAPVASLPDTPAQLSAALELKFLVPVLQLGAKDNSFPNDHRPILVALQEEKDDFKALFRRVHECVASTISQHAVTVERQRSVTLHDIKAAQRQERDFWDTHWIVKKANSALPTAAEDKRGSNYIWVPVEVCSPKQRWNENNALGDALQTVTAVLRALTQRHRVTVNHTCDVHVHVGRLDGAHLSLETVKRLATMLWFSEDAIRSIRDPASPNYQNVFTWGAELTRHSRLARLLDSSGIACQLPQLSHTLTDAQFVRALQRHSPAIHAIWNTDSHLKLGRLLSGSSAQYRRLGFNFSCLGEEDARAKNGPKTIEFRVLEGTLNKDIVASWFSICWKLIDVAGSSDHDDRFIKILKACLGDADVDVGEQYAVRRGRGPDSPRVAEETSVQERRLRRLVVEGLGISPEMYNGFILALLSGRAR